MSGCTHHGLIQDSRTIYQANKKEIPAEIEMKPTEIQFALNLEALSAPQCRRIIEVLVDGSRNSEELSRLCKLTPASIEKHLGVLGNLGLVLETKWLVSSSSTRSIKGKPSCK